ncbi:MAG: PorT family protein [Paludibacteraceae bacterium]|nr:PorT family protein [Paludibacteraceae bacterium]
MKRLIFTYCICLLLTLQGFAQKGFQTQVDFGAGIHSMLFTPEAGEMNLSMGGKLGVTESYYLNDHIGVGVGLYANLHGTKFSLSQDSLSGVLQDTLNEFTYQLNTKVRLNEYIKMFSIDIPLSFRTRFDLNDKWDLRTNIGATFNLPVSRTFDKKGYQTTTAHYIEPNITFHDMPNHGFYTDSVDTSHDFWMQGFGISPFVEVGVSRNITHKCRLYVGAYCSYGISNLLEGNKNYYASKTTSTALSPAITTKANLISAGINIGIIFKNGKEYVETYYDSIPFINEIELDTIVEEVAVIDTLPCIDFVDSIEIKVDTIVAPQKVSKPVFKGRKVRLICTHGVKATFYIREPLNEEFSADVERKLNMIAKSMMENPIEKVVIFSEGKHLDLDNVNAKKKEVTFLYRIKKYLITKGVHSSQIVFGMDGSKK